MRAAFVSSPRGSSRDLCPRFSPSATHRPRKGHSIPGGCWLDSYDVARASIQRMCSPPVTIPKFERRDFQNDHLEVLTALGVRLRGPARGRDEVFHKCHVGEHLSRSRGSIQDNNPPFRAVIVTIGYFSGFLPCKEKPARVRRVSITLNKTTQGTFFSSHLVRTI